MHRLERRHPLRDWSRGLTPFEILVSTILSQSTTVANERRALEDLRTAFRRITPEVLAEAPEAAIARAIWHAGLARQKAPRIRACAREVEARWGGDLETVLRLPTAQARDALMALPGVGPKTADVVLVMAADHPTFPVDTHITRIARRWNLVRRGTYETVRDALEAWTPPKKRKAWHLAVIAHGRELCRARNPLCGACPVRPDCDWYRAQRRSRHPKGEVGKRTRRPKATKG